MSPQPNPLRLAAFSDVHADLMPNGSAAHILPKIAAILRDAGTDVVLIAGDVVNSHRELTRALAPLAVGRVANLYVEGNHDVWLSAREQERGESSFTAQTRLALAAAAAGFTYLPGDPQKIGGWGFAGSLGWYDWSFAHPLIAHTEQMHAAQAWMGKVVWNDVRFARWSRREGNTVRRYSDPEVADLLRERLRADLDTLGVRSGGGGPPTVVATHMLPYATLLRWTGFDPIWDFSNAFMGSVELGRLYDARPAIKLAVAGHTHTPKREQRSNLEVVVSPFGYAALGEFPAELAARIAFYDLYPDGRIVRVNED